MSYRSPWLSSQVPQWSSWSSPELQALPQGTTPWAVWTSGWSSSNGGWRWSTRGAPPVSSQQRVWWSVWGALGGSWWVWRAYGLNLNKSERVISLEDGYIYLYNWFVQSSIHIFSSLGYISFSLFQWYHAHQSTLGASVWTSHLRENISPCALWRHALIRDLMLVKLFLSHQFLEVLTWWFQYRE